MDESSSDFYFYPPGGSAPAPGPAPAPFTIPAPSPAPVPAPTPAPVRPSPSPSPVPAPYVPPSPSPAPAAAGDPQREFEAWEAATRTNTRASVQGYLAQYPQGRYVPIARDMLNKFGASPAPAPAPTPAAPVAAPAANNPQAEFEVWDRAATSNKRADYERYLSLYPQGRYVDLARAALKKL